MVIASSVFADFGDEQMLKSMKRYLAAIRPAVIFSDPEASDPLHTKIFFPESRTNTSPWFIDDQAIGTYVILEYSKCSIRNSVFNPFTSNMKKICKSYFLISTELTSVITGLTPPATLKSFGSCSFVSAAFNPDAIPPFKMISPSGKIALNRLWKDGMKNYFNNRSWNWPTQSLGLPDAGQVDPRTDCLALLPGNLYTWFWVVFFYTKSLLKLFKFVPFHHLYPIFLYSMNWFKSYDIKNLDFWVVL